MANSIYGQSRAPNSQIGRVFSYSWRLNEIRKNLIYNALKKTTNSKKQQSKNLEDLLNGLYTAKHGDSAMQDYEKYVLQILNKYIAEALSKVEVSANNQLSTSGQAWHNKYITSNVLETRVNEISNFLEKLEISGINLGMLGNQLNALKNNFEQLKIQLENLRNQDPINYEATNRTAGGNLRKTSDTGAYIDALDNLYNFIKTLKINLTNAYGYGFEHSLKAFNKLIEIHTEEVTNKVLEKAFNSTTEGQGVVNRGALSSEIFVTDINTIYKTTAGLLGPNPVQYTPGSTIERLVSINSYDPKQGKMDVEFKTPENTFRISAKSWHNLTDSKLNFGETTLFNAIARTAGVDSALAYGLPVGYYNPEGKLWSHMGFHEFAKTCIFLDTVMGYSQSNNYADTIVIQNRSNPARPIRVFSIYDLITKIYKIIKSDEFITGYDYNSIDIRSFIKNSNGAQWWLFQLQSQMHGIKVKVSSGILNLI